MTDLYRFELSDQLKKVLKKLIKKDKIKYEATLKKIEQVCQNPQHYKNLQHGMKEFKRVHIDTSFVLVFKVDELAKKICFEELEHHDVIYER